MNEEWIVCLYFRQKFYESTGIVIESKFERFIFPCEELATKAVEELSIFEKNNGVCRIVKFRTK